MPRYFEFTIRTRKHRIPLYKGTASANVKLHDFGEIGEPYKARLADLMESGHVSVAEWRQQEVWAWDQAASDWWEWAIERARDQGLGRVYSNGASGGYLCLSDYTESTLDGYAEDLEGEQVCDNCGDTFSTHAHRKCSYGPTRYAHRPNQSPHLSSCGELLRVKRFLLAMSRSVDPSFYVQLLEGSVDALWEEFRPANPA